jgi:hypothetical protein
MNPKDKALLIVKTALDNAEDNLHRATMQFVRMSDELTLKYGQSGRTCGEILEQYRSEVAALEECVEWITRLEMSE